VHDSERRAGFIGSKPANSCLRRRVQQRSGLASGTVVNNSALSVGRD
jgi:hypothetical protein